MSAAVKLREDVSAKELRVMARESRDARQSRRLLALAAVAEGRPRWEAVALGGMDRQTLPDWVHRFNSEVSLPKIRCEHRHDAVHRVEASV